MEGSGGTGLIALLAVLIAAPIFGVALMTAMVADDEADDASHATCQDSIAPGTTGGDRLAPPGSFVKPVDPDAVTVSSKFGARWGSEHKGIDLAGQTGTPIYAAADGTVRNAGPADGFGLWVVLDHQIDGALVSTVYGHIETYLVEAGDTVRAGQQIATLGNRGESTGPHLHWEVWLGGWGVQAVDPQPYYDAAPAPDTTGPAGPTTVPAPDSDVGGDLSQPLPVSAGSETSLQVDTKRLVRALHLKFGDRLATLGGWRADGGAATDHPKGRAVDAMIPNYRSGTGVALGDEIVDYVMANAGFFGVEYVIWRQQYYPVGGVPSLMDDLGSDTANHVDHVHITVTGQGFDESTMVWGQLPGGTGTITSVLPDCTISGTGLGDTLAAGSVPDEFAPWISRAGAICPQITPSLLAAQLEAENGFRYGANAPVSVTGAAGPAQFMPRTWATYGQDYDGDGTVDVTSIGDAVMAQGHYMCVIADSVDGWIADGTVTAPNGPAELYLAGYNAGEGAVLASGGFPTGSADYQTQTRPYVDRILAAEVGYRAINQ